MRKTNNSKQAIEQKVPKRRGRPPGSKNVKKVEQIIVEDVRSSEAAQSKNLKIVQQFYNWVVLKVNDSEEHVARMGLCPFISLVSKYGYSVRNGVTAPVKEIDGILSFNG